MDLEKRQIFIPLLTLFIWVSLGTFVYYHFLEDWTLIQSFYFSVSSLTTVGYGDFYPSSAASQLFTSLYILFGVGVVFASLTIIGSKYIKRQEEEIFKRLDRRNLARSKKIIEGIEKRDQETQEKKP